MQKIKCFLLIFVLCSGISLWAQTDKSAIYETNNYKIEFSGQPEVKIDTVDSPLGKLLLTTNSYVPAESKNDDNVFYGLIETKYPESIKYFDDNDSLEEFFQGTIDGAMEETKGKLIQETKEKVGKYPARNVEIDFGDGNAIIKMELILIENKMIMITAITEKSKYPNSDLNKFFKSFEIK